jgi:hypothetical protein
MYVVLPVVLGGFEEGGIGGFLFGHVADTLECCGNICGALLVPVDAAGEEREHFGAG